MLPVIPLNPFKSQLWFGQQVGGHQSSCCHYHAEEVVTLRRLALWILSWVTVFEGSSHCIQFLPRQRRRTHLSQDFHSRPLTGLNCPINVSTPLGSRLCACPMNPYKRDGQLRDTNESCLKCLIKYQLPMKTTMTKYQDPGCGKCQGDFMVDAVQNE